MFQVICIATDEVMDVYDVNGLFFLVWDEEGHWAWAPMENYRPVTTDDLAKEWE